MTKADRKSILAEIEGVQAALDDLDRQRAEGSSRLEALRERLAATSSADAALAPAPTPASASEKVQLFRGLFRGREDVFPRLWANRRKGTKGYSPACAKEWVPGVCEKPRVKCGECPHRAFHPVTDQVVLDHLQGRHVIGVYPMLEDETCWLLAADFDKSSWEEDVGAFVATCREAGIAPAIERSRSGNGAHVWLFFSAPLAVATARRLGCHLLTETMAARHQLSMRSYDRLFPNQDTLPRGGFGNLIALPLQHRPRRDGNTVFLDDSLLPFPDQWAFLAGVQRLEPDRAQRLVREAIYQGRVVGVRSIDPQDGENAEPWQHFPSGRRRSRPIAGPLPSEVRGVLAQRLYVEAAGLAPALLNEIKRVAAFQNPEFYKKQRMRLSTAGTPRVISCAEEHGEHVSLPRGCRTELEGLLGDHGVRLALEDRRLDGNPADHRFEGRLTTIQAKAARALLPHDTGVFVGPPGMGKTVLGTYLLAKRDRNTLVLVHRQPLLAQWAAQLAMFLGVDEGDVGQIGGGKRKPNGRLDVAMLQSLVRRGRVDDSVAGYGHVIVDECHHIPAFSFERVLSEVKARYLLGLTATPERRDGSRCSSAQSGSEWELEATKASSAGGWSFVRRAFGNARRARRHPSRSSIASWRETTPGTSWCSTTSLARSKRAAHRSF